MYAESERILLLPPSPRDAAIAREELAQCGIEGVVCADVKELCQRMSEGAGAALITEDEAFRERGILCEVLAGQPDWSDFPLLILGSGYRAGPDGSLHQLGNVTLLDPPLRIRTLVSAAQAALRSRRRQYAAARAIAERDKFLAMLGHELRNPLSAVALAVEAARRKAEPLSREMNVVGNQVKHLTRLVDDLLDVGRVTAGKFQLRTESIDICSVVKRVAEAMKPRFEAAGLTFTIDCPDNALFSYADETRLGQVVTNLLGNALKYTPRGGTVVLRSRIDDLTKQLILEVEDSGIGIAAEDLPRIFDPFAQVDDSLDRSLGGLGVGLTLVRTIVELHSGTIEAHSDGPGSGSRFLVRLPLTPVTNSKDGKPSKPAYSLGPMAIVVADDHVDGRVLLADAFSAFGHTVYMAADGRAAIELISEHNPDAAVIDIGLPDVDGYQVARTVRQSHPAMRLVALTGYGQTDDRLRAREAGFDEHLTKPASVAEILRALGAR